MEKLITIEIPKYIRKVKLSNSRNKKYYEKGKKEPIAKKYADPSKYKWQVIKGKTLLVDIEKNEVVIANPKAAGTPKFVTINGQKIYNGEVSSHVRNKVLTEIKNQFKEYINKLDPIDLSKFPIKINMEIHDTIKEVSSKSLWDIDNRAWPYIKAFQDCLTGNSDKQGNERCKKIIPDDNIIFVTQAPVPKFIPVENDEDRKLIFTIESETDKRILDNKEFKEELKKCKYEFQRISQGSK